jgi:PAS domain-containing protein
MDFPSFPSTPASRAAPPGPADGPGSGALRPPDADPGRSTSAPPATLLRCAPVVVEPVPAAGDFEAGLGRALLDSLNALVVIQDPQGIILGCSRGLAQAVGRRGRMFGRSYWEAMPLQATDFPAAACQAAMARWRESGRFEFPAAVRERLAGPGGPLDIVWTLLPHFPEPGAAHGLVRIGHLAAAPAPAPEGVELARLAAERDDALAKLERLVRALAEAQTLAAPAAAPAAKAAQAAQP